MCAILAVCAPRLAPETRERARSATTLMAHRGPDGSGFFEDHPSIFLGHRRLSIIDLAGGGQPMFNEDGTIAIVYNGEIYNFDDLRRELEAKGHQFRSVCDTEVIIHAYEEWGEAALTRFNGMFAFALWDGRHQRLWVARDQLGIKPLYYHVGPAGFACASEIRPLLQLLGTPPTIEPASVDAFLTVGYVPGPATLFSGILKLPAGHSLMLEPGQSPRLRPYWDALDAARGQAELPPRELHDLLADAVQKCLRSDVPLGVFLSGGLDSSAVVALMAERGSGSQIQTFTVGFDEPGSETPFAEQIARHFDTRHHTFTLGPQVFHDSLRQLVKQCEEPLVEAPSIALYHLAKLARDQVTVVLSGEGSDEVFGGYSIYRSMLRIEQWRRWLPGAVWQAGAALGQSFLSSHLQKYADWCTLPLARRFQGTSALLTQSLRRRYFAPDFLASCGSYLAEAFTRPLDRALAKGADPLQALQYADLCTWLPDNLLVKADKMTMAASIELRVPFLDHRVVAAGLALPMARKVNRQEGKLALKEIAYPLLPKAIVDRPKAGFPVPTQRWLQGELYEQVRDWLHAPDLLPWVPLATRQRLLREHRAGQADHSRFLLTLVILAAWRQSFGV